MCHRNTPFIQTIHMTWGREHQSQAGKLKRHGELTNIHYLNKTGSTKQNPKSHRWDVLHHLFKIIWNWLWIYFTFTWACCNICIWIGHNRQCDQSLASWAWSWVGFKKKNPAHWIGFNRCQMRIINCPMQFSLTQQWIKLCRRWQAAQIIIIKFFSCHLFTYY